MNDRDYQHWVASARERAQAAMDKARASFGLGTYARHEVDLASASIRFLDTQGVEKVRADLQVAGSWSPNSGTWMWGWENESVPEAAVTRLGAIAETGDEHDVAALKAHVVECDEAGAWSLAALAADIVDAECVYSTGGAKNRSFFLLFNLRKVD